MKFGKKIYLLLILSGIFFYANNLNAQIEDIFQKTASFYFDAVVFDSWDKTDKRVDLYMMVPGQTLLFLKSGDIFGAKYSLNISVYDSSETEIFHTSIEGKIIETDYFAAQGGTGIYDIKQKVMALPHGRYRIKVRLVDELANKEYSLSRNISVLNFDDFPLSLSGILFVSSVEEKKDGGYIITPHISDNVGNLENGFFLFYEIYNRGNEYTELDFVYEIVSKEGETVYKSKKIRKALSKNIQQEFLKVTNMKEIATGNYNIQLIALKPTDSPEYTIKDYIAVAQRTMKIVGSIGGNVIKDLNKAIKQLRYIAYQDEMTYIESGATYRDKEKRFEEFWKKKDPTPTTEFNEAFMDYYSRIAYANKNFRSYTEGWITDKGMVYVVFGKPYDIKVSQRYSDGRVYEIWYYNNNMTFRFVDNTGLGDFRLFDPITVNRKYEYNK